MADIPALGVDTSLPGTDIPSDLAASTSPGLATSGPSMPAMAPPTTPATPGAPPSFDGGVAGPTDSSFRSKIVNFARQYLGNPYVWGGTKPGGFDCSGLVQWVTGHFGLQLPRISYQQANFGQATSIGNLKPGDLVAWDENSRNPGADHIAFYIGNGYILEAPHTGANVRIRKLGSSEGAWGVHLHYPGDTGPAGHRL